MEKFALCVDEMWMGVGDMALRLPLENAVQRYEDVHIVELEAPYFQFKAHGFYGISDFERCVLFNMEEVRKLSFLISDLGDKYELFYTVAFKVFENMKALSDDVYSGDIPSKHSSWIRAMRCHLSVVHRIQRLESVLNYIMDWQRSVEDNDMKSDKDLFVCDRCCYFI